jgi:Effector Associated Constant Component 1
MLPGSTGGDVPIQIRVTGPDADRELGSLYAWLLEEPDIRRYARVSLIAAAPGPAEMGAAFDIIQLVTDSGFQALNLALAYATWRATRPGRPQVVIERDDTRITLDSAGPDSVEAIVRALG